MDLPITPRPLCIHSTMRYNLRSFTIKNITHHKLILMFVLTFLLSSHAGGFAAFSEKTPRGNSLEYSGSDSYEVVFSYAQGGGYYPMKRFYFYKEFLIGESETGFYVINEVTNSIREFSEKTEFTQYLKEQKLKPLIFTRWFNYCYDESVNALFLWPILFIFVPIPLVLPSLLLYSVISLIFWKKPRFKKSKIVFISLVALSFVVTFAMQSYLYSF